MQHSWKFVGASSGERLDRFLAKQSGVARNQVQQWITAGHVLVNGRQAKSSAALAPGDTVVCRPPVRDQVGRLEPEPGPLDILFEDRDLAILNKPAGLAMHPGAGRSKGTLANFVLEHFPEVESVGGPGRPGIVHRLDLGTTGVLAIAKTEVAYQNLSRAFAERSIEKKYVGFVFGCPKRSEGRIDASIGRHPHQRQQMIVRPDGRHASTTFEVLDQTESIAILSFGLDTGRTHQIRVHAKWIGHPLVGDPVYGEARWKALPKTIGRHLAEFSRPALHAWQLGFEHPVLGGRINFEAPIPEDLRDLWVAVAQRTLPDSLLRPPS
jgi:23S rRNA pseudouridine1911/1915/1917 synthase